VAYTNGKTEFILGVMREAKLHDPPGDPAR
jgi:hypothetical protein